MNLRPWPVSPWFRSEPRPNPTHDQQAAAQELVGAVDRLFREAALGDEPADPSLDDLPTFADALLDLTNRELLTDDQAHELLRLFIARVAEAEVVQVTSDLLVGSFDAVHDDSAVRF